MASLYRRLGIILNRSNVGRADRRVTLFAADGKHVLRARGTQKLESKLAGSLEPLTLVDLTIARGRTMDQVTGSVIRDAYRSIRQHLPRIAGAGLLVSAADSLVQGLLDDRMPYTRIREAFALISRSRTNRDVLLAVAYGLWNLSASLGYRPHPASLSVPVPVRTMTALLLCGDVNAVRRIRSRVSTARACAAAALYHVEMTAERPLPASRFFRRMFGMI